MTRWTLAAALTILAPAAARAQVASPTVPSGSDSGRVVLETRLGGDSSQATTVNLRRGATYRVWVRPARAEIAVRRLTRDTAAAARAAHHTTTQPSEDSTHMSRVFNITARAQGEHIVELTNPQVGGTSVRITFLHRAAYDTLPTSARRTLLYNEATGTTGIIVSLDSGKVYRLQSDDDVYIAPRSGYRAPVRLAPLIRGGGSGVPFIPEFTGEYRVYGGTSVRIYEEEADAAEIACIRNPSGPGCHGKNNHGLGVLLALVSIPIVAYVFFVK
jgi:hypothetical protein